MLQLKRPGPGMAFRRVALAARDVLLPPTCASCRAAVADAGALCPACWAQIRFIAAPLCPVTGLPFSYDMGPGVLSAEALADPPPFRRARSAAIYGDVARRLVHHVKYHDRPDLAGVLATAMHRAGHELLADAAVIVPVPLYRWRLWQRRFNQAALLADGVSRLSGVAHDPFVLSRVKPTRRQVGLSARATRGERARRVPRAGGGEGAHRRVRRAVDRRRLHLRRDGEGGGRGRCFAAVRLRSTSSPSRGSRRCSEALAKLRRDPISGGSTNFDELHPCPRSRSTPASSAATAPPPNGCCRIAASEFEEIDTTGTPDKRNEMIERSGRFTFPQIFIGTQHIGGCDDLYALHKRGDLDTMLAA